MEENGYVPKRVQVMADILFALRHPFMAIGIVAGKAIGHMTKTVTEDSDKF